MIRRTAAVSVLALAMAGCATYPAGNVADGSYTGAYNDGYYSAAANGNGDYYYDRPQVVVNGYETGPFYGFYPGYGFGSPWGFGFSPWIYGPGWGYGPWYRWGWHRPWCCELRPAVRRFSAFPDTPRGGPHGGTHVHGFAHETSH